MKQELRDIGEFFTRLAAIHVATFLNRWERRQCRLCTHVSRGIRADFLHCVARHVDPPRGLHGREFDDYGPGL